MGLELKHQAVAGMANGEACTRHALKKTPPDIRTGFTLRSQLHLSFAAFGSFERVDLGSLGC